MNWKPVSSHPDFQRPADLIGQEVSHDNKKLGHVEKVDPVNTAYVLVRDGNTLRSAHWLTCSVRVDDDLHPFHEDGTEGGGHFVAPSESEIAAARRKRPVPDYLEAMLGPSPKGKQR